MFKGLFISGLYVSIGVVLGRIAGFIREILLASIFGVSAQADMAVLILTIPDLFSGLLIGGAMSAAFVPFFRGQDKQNGIKLWAQASMFAGVFFSMLTGIFCVGILFIIKLFAPGMGSDFIVPLSHLLQISLWSIPFTALSGLCGAYLQANDRFFITASSALIINVVLIISLLQYQNNSNILWILSVAISIGALLRWLLQGISMLILSPSSATVAVRKTLNRDILLHYFQAMAGGSLLILLPFIARSFASLEGKGAIARFNYAIKLMDLPYAIALTSFAVVLLPKLSDLFKQRHTHSQAIKVAEEGLLLMWILALSLVIVLFWFAEPLVSLVYGWGGLTPKNLVDIAFLFKWGILGLPALGFNTLLTALFNAKQNTRTPFLVYLFCFILFLPMAFLAQRYQGLIGILFVLVGIHWLIFLMLFYFLESHYSFYLWKKFFNMNVIKVLAVHCLIFIPIAIGSLFLKHSIWLMLFLAIFSGLLLLLSGLLVIASYRSIAYSFFKDYLKRAFT